ncbi:MAG: hypothetical protein FD123_50 [Bacteroidetes bacterium]|nr:MAG: hypothetical protein FD123_50 [Bacteroidota bacterium]
MRYSEDLEKLVRSLSKAEKRYFRLSAEMHEGDKSYLTLFEKLAKKRAVKKESPDYDTRRYLFSQLMKSLAACRDKHSVDAEIYGLLTAVDVLYEKDLRNVRRKALQRARKLAVQFERIELLLEINRLERVGILDEALSEKILLEQRALLLQAANINEYRHLAARVSSLYAREGEIRSPEQLAVYENLMRHELLQSESAALSTEAQYFFFFIHVVFTLLADRPHEAYAHNRKLIALLEARPWLLRQQQWQKRYADILDNQFLICSTLSETGEAEELLRRSRQLPGYARTFTLKYLNLLGVYIRNGDFEKGQNALKELEDYLARPDAFIPAESKTVLYCNIAVMHFGAGQFRKSLDWLNRILNDAPGGAREDVLALARLLNLMLHFELQHTDLLEYLVKSTYRFLGKKSRLYKFESVFLHSVRERLLDYADPRELRTSFATLKAELEEVLKDPYEKRVLEYFDIIAWLQSKVEQRSFAEIVKERAGKP